MNGLIRLSGLWLAAAVLAGCATKNIDQNYRLSAERNEGLVIGSITYTGPLAEYRAYYHLTPAQPDTVFFSAGVAMVPPFPRSDFHDGSSGELFSASLPAGDYVFDGWRVHSGPAQSWGPMETPVRFTVTPGKATYVGNFLFAPSSRLGLTVLGANVVYSEQLERDLATFKALYPGLAGIDVQRLNNAETPYAKAP